MKRQGKVLILEWGKGPILTHISTALEALGYELIIRERWKLKDIPDIVQAIEEHQPALCVTRQRIYWQMKDVTEALSAIHCRKLIVDLGVWPHYQTYMMDSEGENAASSVVGNLNALESDPEIRAEVDRYQIAVDQMRETLRERAGAATSRIDELGLDIPKSYSLVILQREGDQVLNHDADPQWRDPLIIAKKAIEEAERTNRFVVIKPHPQTSLELEIPSDGPHHRIVSGFKPGPRNDQQLAWLMVNARNAMMVNSTCHFQTMALGIPTACLGRGWFSDNDVVVEAQSIAAAMANKITKPGDRYLSHMMSRQMPIPQFAEPEALDRLMRWIWQGETVLSQKIKEVG